MPWAGKLPISPSPQQASVSAGLETRNIGAAMAGIAMRSINLCTSARGMSQTSPMVGVVEVTPLSFNCFNWFAS